MASHGAASFTYTAAGELLTKTEAGQTTTYAYDPLGALREVQLPGGTTITYVIDGLGRRVGKKRNGILERGWLYSDALRIVGELDGSNALVSRFVYADGVNVPEYLVRAGGTYRIVTDHLGSPRLVVNAATGEIVQRTDYDAWGQVVFEELAPGFAPIPFGFAGGLYDRDTGLVRFGARDYEPTSGRWTSKDPIGFRGGSNPYAYAANTPSSLVDPTGLVDQCVPGVPDECPRTEPKGQPGWTPQTSLFDEVTTCIFHGCKSCYREDVPVDSTQCCYDESGDVSEGDIEANNPEYNYWEHVRDVIRALTGL